MRELHLSFGGGEVSPELFGRLDDARVRAGAAEMRNFIPKPHGVVYRRPGSRFVRATRDSLASRMVEFNYPSTDAVTGRPVMRAVALEFGVLNAAFNSVSNGVFGGYMRVHSNGATVTCTPSPWATNTNYVVGDLVSNAGTNYYCHAAHNSGAGPFPSPSVGFWYPMPAGGIFEMPTRYTAADVFDFHYAQRGSTMRIASPLRNPADLTRSSDTRWTLVDLSLGASSIGAPTGVGVTVKRGTGILIAEAGLPLTTPNVASYDPFVVLTVDQNGLTLGDTVYLTGLDELAYGLGDVQFTAGGTTVTTRDGVPNPEVHGLALAQPVKFGGPVPSPLSTSSTYYVANPNGATFQLAPTRDDAFANTNLITTATAPGGCYLKFPDGFYIAGKGTPGSGLSTTPSDPNGRVLALRRAVDGLQVKAHNAAGAYTPNRGLMQYASLSTEITNYYVVTAIDANGAETVQSSAVSADNNLFVPGASNIIKWTRVTGAKRYRVYKRKSNLYGVIGTVDDALNPSFVDDNIGPDLSITPPLVDQAVASNFFPAAVGFYEQRGVLAGTPSSPEDIWLTQTNAFSSFTYTLPVVDTNRIYVQLVSNSGGAIQHIVSMGHLIVLTTAGEFRVTPLNSDALTPDSISVRPQGAVGCNTVQPVVVNDALVFCTSRGGRVREMGFDVNNAGFLSSDVSLRAIHLFDGYTLLDLAYQRAPYPVLWFVSSNGSLLSFTYVPEEKVGAWAMHTTDSGDAFVSACAVREGNEDVVYVCVRRTVGGTVHYVERIAEVAFATASDAFFVDSGVTATPSGLTVSGLSHLNGRTVSVLVDGAVQTQKVVAGGQITLDKTGAKAQVGLPVTARLKTAPFASQIEAGAQGRTKNIVRVWARVTSDSGQFKVGANSNPTTPSGPITDNVIEARVLDDWNQNGQLVIEQTDPLPLTIVGVTLEVQVGS